MNIVYHGHSCISIECEGKKLLIDPFITGNQLTDLDVETVEADYILVTHGHSDHVGDTVDIAKRTEATVITNYELGTYFHWQGVKSVHTMNTGGSYTFTFGRVTMTQAIHSSGYVAPDRKEIVYGGIAAGFMIESEGVTVYHAGDTDLFSDMELIGEKFDIDVAFLPIGDNYTMGIDDAVIAVEWLQADLVIPIHYNTWPVIEQNPVEFVEGLPKDIGLILEPGEGITIE